MYKNRVEERVAPQGWGRKGAMGSILKALLYEKKEDETEEKVKEDFYGSHTYLWLLEEGSWAPPDYKDILKVYYAEKKAGFIGFVHQLLVLYEDDIDFMDVDV